MHNLTSGYLIHQKAYLERKQWLTLLTQDAGLLVTLQHRSAKKTPIQPFQRLKIHLQYKNQEYKAKQIEIDGFTPPIPIDNIWRAQYLNELIFRLYQPEMPTQNIFASYQKTILQLQHTPTSSASIRLFEYHLQQAMGYGLCYQNLDQNPSQWWHFNPEEGLLPSSHERKQHIHRDHLLGLRDQQWHCLEVQNTSKHIFYQVIKSLLGEKPIFIKNLIPPT